MKIILLQVNKLIKDKQILWKSFFIVPRPIPTHDVSSSSYTC